MAYYNVSNECVTFLWGHPKKKCLFGIAAQGFLDPVGKEFYFSNLKKNCLKNSPYKKRYFLANKILSAGGHFNQTGGNSKQT